MSRFIYSSAGYAWINDTDSLIESGDVVVNRELIAIACANIGVGETGWISIKGCWELPAVEKDAATLGAIAYYSVKDKAVTVTADGNKVIGKFIKPKIANETTASIVLG